MPRRRHLLRATIAAAAWPAGHAAVAQPAWPVRPVRVILPDTPGTGNDTTARLLAPHLEAALGQPFVPDNRPGAGGRLGVEAAWRAPPDGYTLLLGNAGSNGINAAIYRDLPYDLATGFEPISLLVAGPNVLSVNARLLPVDTPAELVAAIHARPPGALSYGSAGVGSSAHMSMELFKTGAGLDILHVPYRGAPAMAQAVIAGDVALFFANLVNVMPLIRRGDLRPIAVTGLTRWPELPEVPTLHETILPGFETLAWNGLLAPPGTPRAIVDRLHATVVQIARDPTLNERVRVLGGTLVASTPEELGARIRADIAKWRDLAARANIRAE
jgi:tripartite-type tricarboxylate transporter receptor subunit TctC